LPFIGYCFPSIRNLWPQSYNTSPWLRYRPVPVIPIIGARKLSQLQDNLASFNLALSAEQVKALDEASQIDPGFPYHLYAKEHVRAVAYGGMRDQILA
jgi:aldo/keto reductase family protein